MGFLDVYKKILLNDNNSIDISFIPTNNYIPQTALKNSSGSLEVYIDNEFIANVNRDTMFIIINHLDILEFFNYKHAILVLKGLIKYSLTYLQRKDLYNKNNSFIWNRSSSFIVKHNDQKKYVWNRTKNCRKSPWRNV